MKQLIPTLLLNAAVAFSVFVFTSMYYRGKYFSHLEDYQALRIEHSRLIQDSKALDEEMQAVLGKIKAALSK